MKRRVFLAGALPAMPLAPNVRLDDDGMVVLHGTRTFVLGLYQLPQGPDGWKNAAKAGFHVLHVGNTREALDNARAHGMYGWVTLGSLRKPEDEARIRRLVRELKDHPQLLFWETEDEPSFVWKKPREFRVSPQTIRETYLLVKSMDPLHPIYLNHSPTNLVSTLARYNPGGDLIATDVYPVIAPGSREQYALWPDGQQGDLLNSSISQVGPYVEKMRQVAGKGRGVWMVLQGFAWEMLREENREPAMIRYPTRAETRFMAYQAIVRGASGLLWWGLHRTPPESGLWESIAATATELKGLAKELAARSGTAGVTIEYHDTGHSLDRGIEWIVKTPGKGAMLIAVNADKNPVEATITAGAWRKREEFEPFGVRLWRVAP
ncbi:MAG TPA: hypothetical protein VM120_16410 [Bryobacteraceae bacterium]|nr:hypothetical protein [Bryobacteraceae bacterium]